MESSEGGSSSASCDTMSFPSDGKDMVSQEAEDEPPSDDSTFCSSLSFFMFVKMPVKNMKIYIIIW